MDITVRTQAELDAALKDGKVAICVEGSFRLSVGGIENPKIIVTTNAKLSLECWGSSAPSLVCMGSSAPSLVCWESSAPSLVCRGSSAPSLECWGSSAPSLVCMGSRSGGGLIERLETNKKEGEYMFRQGDVLMRKVQFIPTTAVKQEKCILALGEATGHAHQIKRGAYLYIDTDRAKYIDVLGTSAVVEHEEHGHITLDGPAVYLVTQQREYTPEEIRNVHD